MEASGLASVSLHQVTVSANEIDALRSSDDGLSYTGAAIDTRSDKPPPFSMHVRDLVAIHRLQHNYVLNPYANSPQNPATVYTSRFVGKARPNPNYWLPHGFGVVSEGRNKLALYEGEFVNGFRQGFGKAPIFERNPDRFVGQYRGQWEKGHRHGVGELTDMTSGTTFLGEWKYDVKHGRGQEHYADGSRYVGLWANGERHGPGMLCRSDTKDGIFLYDYAHGKPSVESHKKKTMAADLEWDEWFADVAALLDRTFAGHTAITGSTSATVLTGLSGKAGLKEKKLAREYNTKEVPMFAQQISAAAGKPVSLNVDIDSFLQAAESKVTCTILTEGQSQYLLVPLVKAIETVCQDAMGKQAFAAAVDTIAVKHDRAVGELTQELVDKTWSITANFEDPSAVLLPTKMASWLERHI
ncbi:Ankyrin repeat and MYND domain containing 1 [Balamuthia mandrillaris]